MKKSIGAQTILYPTPVCIVGTYDDADKANVMTAAWAGICCSKPPALYVSLRKSRYSYEAVKKRNAFTVSLPSATHVREADYFGIVSGRREDKFEKTGLTPVRAERVDAPYVKEFPVAIECRLMQIVPLGVHDMCVGEIMDVKVAESALSEDGSPDIEKIMPMIFAPGNQAYFGVGDFLGKAFSTGKSLI